MSELEEFCFACVNDYEQMMEKPFNTAKQIGELQFAHQEAKTAVIKTLAAKWKATFDAQEMSHTVKTTVQQKIDESFAQLKEYFKSKTEPTATAKARSADGDKKVKEDALTFYVDEMTQFCDNTQDLERPQVVLKHQELSKEALKKAMAHANVREGAHLLTKLAFEMESRFKEFLRRAEEEKESNVAIGIDLGTTMCCVMVVNEEGKPEVVLNTAQGKTRTTPSYVAFLEDGSNTFGVVAKERAYKFPELTIYDAKRMIGRNWDDPVLQRDILRWPFKVVEENGNPKVETVGRTRYPQEVSARLLAQFRAMAEDHLKLPRGSVRKAVVTVPAYFTELQRRATNEAASCAGLQVLNILSEPTAAAIAYSFERRTKNQEMTALVYDLGGGTFDVSIANISDTDVDILCVDGDSHLGGQDFDNLLLDLCIDEFYRSEDYDLRAARNHPEKLVRDDALRALSRVKLQCEEAKEKLSCTETTTIYVECLVGSKSLNLRVTRKMLDALCRPLIQRSLDIVGRALEEAKSKGVKGKGDIDEVILIGGSTRMLLVEQMLSEYFGGKELCKSINPDEAVAYGAAVQAAIMAQGFEETVVPHVIPTDSVVNLPDEIRQLEIQKKTDDSIPEEPVVEKEDPSAYLKPEKSSKRQVKKIPMIKVTDVLPLSLGIEEVGDYFSEIIPKNATIPCERSSAYQTADDDQTVIQIRIFQGGKPKCSDNKLLGEFTLEGFPPKPAGEERISVTMKINEMGILQVGAVSLTTGNEKAITITAERMGMDLVTMEELKKTLVLPPIPKARR